MKIYLPDKWVCYISAYYFMFFHYLPIDAVQLAVCDRVKRMRTINIIKKTLFIAMMAGGVSVAQASVNYTPTQLVDMAGPTEWKNLDVVINPSALHWENTADKNAFLTYQDAYLMEVTKSWDAMDDQYADDALTVASECVLRKNIVMDDYFNKVIDTFTVLRKRIAVAPFIMGILFD